MISIIIPFHNEEENVSLLYKELKEALGHIHEEYEIVYVDDGSTDKSKQEVEKLAHEDHKVKLVSLRKRFGKGKAISLGVQESKGDTIIFMDADLQDDPRDIPKFLEKLHTGFDVINGVRSSRQDSSIIKFYSKGGNSFLRSFLHSPFTDINCGFKAFKRKVLDEIVIYGNNFRFIPLAAYYQGFKVGEVSVANRKRIHGVSKFGLKKPFIGFIDTITAYFLYQFSERPLHFFGIIGAIFVLIGFIILGYLGIERIIFQQLIYRRPILFVGLLAVIVGVQITMTGFIGELVVYLHKKK
ncbi:MAG: glycosyltransferase family 2 protein [bacterium]|nr:glycosyltransferase family 2 protein [bacterium]